MADFGSASLESSLGRPSSISLVRWITHTTLPRHSTLIFWPSSSLLMSTSIGTPAALARSLGQKVMQNGTADAITPTVPTAVVAPRRNRRFALFTLPSIATFPVPGRKLYDYR